MKTKIELTIDQVKDILLLKHVHSNNPETLRKLAATQLGLDEVLIVPSYAEKVLEEHSWEFSPAQGMF
jgi:hypothetical protein